VQRLSAPPGRLSLLQRLKPLSIADVVLLTQQFIRSGSWSLARQLCEEAIAHWGNDTALTVSRAMVELGAGQRPLAESLLDEVLADHPEHLAALYTSAWMNIQRGKPVNAREQLLTIARVFADYPGALGTLATLLLPGPSYREVLAFIHQTLRPASYLEIGVETGATLKLARLSSTILGVDPDLSQVQQDPVVSRARLFPCTSDEFFDRQTPQSALNSQTLDFAFIDGMHQFEYVLRDFCSIEAWASHGTVVAMHDVLPILPVVATRERQTKFWVGDTWKALWILLEHRPDLTISVIPTAPSGIAIIRGFSTHRAFTDDQLDAALEKFAGLAYPELEPGTFPTQIPLVPNSVLGWHSALGTPEGSA
jgi:predicted O-methyltransferase YrrM